MQTVVIGDLYAAPLAANEPGFHKRDGDLRYAGPPHAEHLRQEHLRQAQCIAVREMARRCFKWVERPVLRLR